MPGDFFAAQMLVVETVMETFASSPKDQSKARVDLLLERCGSTKVIGATLNLYLFQLRYSRIKGERKLPNCGIVQSFTVTALNLLNWLSMKSVYSISNSLLSFPKPKYL